MADRICSNCNKPFSVPAAWVRKGAGKFCSRPCYTTHQQRHPHTRKGLTATPRKTLECLRCGIRFKVWAKTNSRGFCSLACSQASVSREVKCRTCDKMFRSYGINGRQHFCSRTCKKAATFKRKCLRCHEYFYPRPNTERKHCSENCRRPLNLSTCLTCAKTRRIRPSEVGVRRFCSPVCYRRFTGETEPERNVRLTLELLGIKFEQEYAVKGWRYPVDFYLPEMNLLLEVDEPYWHKDSERDARKTKALEAKGYQVCRMVATPFYGAINEIMAHHLKTSLRLLS